MQYENQKAACADYAQRNGGSVADVLRISGRKGAVVLSKDGRTIFDPFVIEPIAEVITAKPMKEMENAVKERVNEEVKVELPAAEPKKKTAPRKKK
jgi:hypothetical protein